MSILNVMLMSIVERREEIAPVDLWILLHPTNALYLLLAFSIGVAISVVNGLYPAWNAANERPVDALRS